MKINRRFYLKNLILFAILLANLIGLYFVNTILFWAEGAPDTGVFEIPLPYWVATLYTPLAFIFLCVMTICYELPIRRCLDLSFKKETIPQELKDKACRRLLNEPFVLIALTACMWLLASIIYSTIYWVYAPGLNMIPRVLGNALITVVVIVTIAFFLLEHILQRRLAPEFFPNGGLTAIPGTLKIRIRTRLGALLFASNLIPLVSIMLLF